MSNKIKKMTLFDRKIEFLVIFLINILQILKNPQELQNCISWGFKLAERMGFEPTIQLPIYKLSRLAPSTTRTPL